MKDPQPIHLITSEENRASGWVAEERDADGHVISLCAPFENDKDIVWYVREAMKRGGTVTIWPHKVKDPSAFYFD